MEYKWDNHSVIVMAANLHSAEWMVILLGNRLRESHSGQSKEHVMV